MMLRILPMIVPRGPMLSVDPQYEAFVTAAGIDGLARIALPPSHQRYPVAPSLCLDLNTFNPPALEPPQPLQLETALRACRSILLMFSPSATWPVIPPAHPIFRCPRSAGFSLAALGP
mmetsp:Transcript_46004/g.72072  ORF Transcript_46004/g.72072 Transcript_46004/m.72072 type:complete len:118 (-) Transcript_46004:227-580(-)